MIEELKAKVKEIVVRTADEDLVEHPDMVFNRDYEGYETYGEFYLAVVWPKVIDALYKNGFALLWSPVLERAGLSEDEKALADTKYFIPQLIDGNLHMKAQRIMAIVICEAHGDDPTEKRICPEEGDEFELMDHYWSFDVTELEGNLNEAGFFIGYNIDQTLAY